MAKKRRKKGSPWPLALIFRLIVILSASSLIVSYISVYISPEVTSIPLFFGLYFIPLVFINLTLLIIALIRRSGAGWITFAALLPSLLFADLFVSCSRSDPGREGISLDLCTYNVGMFAQQKAKTREQATKEVAEFIAEQKPEIVCLQEFFIRDTASIAELFPDYPYRHSHLFKLKSGSMFGNLTLSKFPYVSKGKITFRGSTNLCIYTDIEHFGKRLRIYNTHLESHNISFTSLIKKMSNSQRASEELIEVHDKLAGAFKKRALQVDSISGHASACTYPSLICGDFNDTPMSYTYNILTDNKKDSFKEAGKGFSATYRYLWPLLRIDYILFPQEYWCMQHRTEKVPYSDHYPIFAQIIIP